MQLFKGGFEDITVKLLSVLRIIPKEHRMKIAAIGAIFLFLSLLDLTIVTILGFLSSTLIKYLLISNPESYNIVLPIFNKNFAITPKSIIIISFACTLMLLLRFICTIKLTRYALNYLSMTGNAISNKLLISYLRLHSRGFSDRSQQQNLFVISTGPINLMTGVVGNLMLVLSDSFLILLMFLATLFTNYKMSLVLFGFLFIITIFLNNILSSTSRRNSRILHQLNLESDANLTEILGLKYEIALSGAQEKFARKMFFLRNDIVKAQTELKLISYKLRISFEAITIIVLLVTFAIAFIIGNVNKAATTASIFLFAFYRIATASLQLQHNFFEFRRHLDISPDTVQFHDESEYSEDKFKKICQQSINPLNFDGSLVIKNLNYKYDDESDFSIKNLNLSIEPGNSLCILGKSGAGKSTLLKLILGLYEPLSGEIQIGGLDPKCASNYFPGAIGYVSQNTQLIKGDLFENVALNKIDSNISINEKELIINALIKAGFRVKDSFSPIQLNWNGENLSGGERQRLGLARALYNSSKLIIFDEPTNALDNETEKLVLDNILEKDEATKIIVTHNRSIAKMCDYVLFVENGETKFFGSNIEFNSKNFF